MTTYEVYSKKVEQIMEETNKNISNERSKIIKLLVTILILFLISLILKKVASKYYADSEKLYIITKVGGFYFGSFNWFYFAIFIYYLIISLYSFTNLKGFGIRLGIG